MLVQGIKTPMASEDLFSKALKSPEKSLDVNLPPDDVDVGVVDSSDEEEEARERKSRLDEKNGTSDSDSESDSGSDSSSGSDSDEKSDTSGVTVEEGPEVEDEDEEPSPEGAIKSKHEMDEEPIPELPDGYEIDSNAKLTEIGVIKSAFENNIVIHSIGSGEKRVLKEGSILCLEDRTLIGTLCEVFGKLENPFYRVSLPASRHAQFDELKERIGEKAFIVVPEAHWIDTFELKKIKGTDASNGYDEELSEDEQEFSDDEKEALYKRAKKERRKNKNADIKDLREKVESGTYKKPKAQRQSKQYPKMQPPVGMTQHGYRSRNSRQEDRLRQPVQSISPQPQPQIQAQTQPYYPQASPASSISYQAPVYGQQVQPMQPHYYQQPSQQYLGQPQHLSPLPSQHMQQVVPPTYNTQYGQPVGPAYYPQVQQMYSQTYTQYPQAPPAANSYHASGVPPPPQAQPNMQQVLQLHSLLMQQQQEANQRQREKKEFIYED